MFYIVIKLNFKNPVLLIGVGKTFSMLSDTLASVVSMSNPVINAAAIPVMMSVKTPTKKANSD